MIVQLNPQLAKQGSGFYDFGGRQDIFPPFRDGKPVIDHVFDVKETAFIRDKLGTGELIIPSTQKGAEGSSGNSEGSKGSKDTKTISVFVDGKSVSKIQVPAGASEEEISQLVLMDKAVTKACGDKEIKKFSIKNDSVVITVK